jgi:hypothetical protein
MMSPQACFCSQISAQGNSKSLKDYVNCILQQSVYAIPSEHEIYNECGNTAATRPAIGVALFFQYWQSGYSTLIVLAWSPVTLAHERALALFAHKIA